MGYDGSFSDSAAMHIELSRSVEMLIQWDPHYWEFWQPIASFSQLSPAFFNWRRCLFWPRVEMLA